ncbi:MAG: hypothetical protein IPL46_08165 [Saprospiraceae bacterium]|nr:hypothetical protein [Saprospiraceae bacterium]
MVIVQIADDDSVLRRVPTSLPNYVKPDGTITRMAFNPKTGAKGLSVNLERLSSAKETSLGFRGFRILRVKVDSIRNEINDGLDVKHEPVQDNEAHCLIIGNITKGKAGDLLRASSEVLEEE